MPLDDIKTLSGKFESSEELQKYCDNQFLIIQKLQSRVKSLEEEIAHFKAVESSQERGLNASELPVEQLICEMQIKKLERAAMDRELTLEETKRLDLLVKNLHLIRDANAKPAEEPKPLEDIPMAQLILIASGKEHVIK